MALDLAKMDKRWGFSIIVMKWKVFLEGCLFLTINCVITPPRLNGLWIKQQSFRQCVEQSKWNYLLEKEEEGGNKDDDDTDNNDEDDNEDTDDDDLINDASSTPTSNKKHKYNTIMPGGKNYMSKSNMAKSYPHLLQAFGAGEEGSDPTNPSVQKSMRSLLSESNNLLSTAYQLDVTGLSNKRISYV